MAFRVEITPRAKFDLDQIYRWAKENAPYRGPIWFIRFEQAILSLEYSPNRCCIEPHLSGPEYEVRKLLFGRKSHIYVVYFVIDSDVVRVLHVRHGARKTLKTIL